LTSTNLVVSPNRDAAQEPPDQPTRKRPSQIVLLPKRCFNLQAQGNGIVRELLLNRKSANSDRDFLDFLSGERL